MTPHSRLTAFVLLALALPVCLYSLPARDQAPADPAVRAAQEANIQESVLRYFIVNWQKSSEQIQSKSKDPHVHRIPNFVKSQTCFISLNGEDPSDDFLRKIGDLPCLAKKASQMGEVNWYISDPVTREPAPLFTVRNIRWIKPAVCRVDVVFQICRENYCEAEQVYQVEHVRSQWKVTRLVGYVLH